MSELRIFLAGEGVSDIGDLAADPIWRKGREGFLQPLVRTMLGDKKLSFDGIKLTNLPRRERGVQSVKELQARNAEKALAFAAARDFDALVFSCDVDKSLGQRASASESRKRLSAQRRSVEHGFGVVRRTIAEAHNVKTAIAIPCRMIEAWALADRKALARLVGATVDTLSYRPVEELWGDEHDPGSDHPKNVWARITRRQVEFAEIGAEASPTTMREACPESFPPFLADIDSMRED